MSSSEQEAYQLKRKVIPGSIDVHPTENALIVNYTVQATIIGEDGLPVGGDKKMMSKTIRVKALSNKYDIGVLAQEVVDKCKLIHPNKVKDVEQQLYYLKQRSKTDGTLNKPLQKQMEESMYASSKEVFQGEAPDINDIEQYIEGLYEEMPDKINSTRNILQLSRVPENMEILIENEALMSAISRVLREDGKKSMELVTNIIYIFFCFSNFSHFHPVITANKIGDMCLRVADQEIQRYNIWVQDIQKLEKKCAINPDSTTHTKELEQEHRKFQAMLKKQDQLLFVSFHLLLNLAEDLNIEVKIVKRDIVKYLIIMMDRKTPELLILAITFLKKLTIFKENKEELLRNSDDFISKMDKILQMDNPGLQLLGLRLLVNLSLDEQFRLSVMKKGLLKNLVKLFASTQPASPSRPYIEQELYLLSADSKSKPMFAYTECCPLILRMILEAKSDKVNPELMALGINLAINEKNSQIMCEDSGVKFLMKRAIKTKDSLLLKMLRNVSYHPNTKMTFLDFIDDMMHFMFKCFNSPELLVEVLGILGNLSIPEFDFAKLSEAYKLHDFIASTLSSAVSASKQAIPKSTGLPTDATGGLADDDDITLQVIVLLGTMSADDGMAPIVVKTNIIQSLLELMMTKEEDDEIVLQITYCIYNLLFHKQTREALISKTQIVSYLIDLLYDRNIEIRRLCDACLDIIVEIDDEWTRKIQLQKFQWHNAEWLASISNQGGDGEEATYEESAVLYAKKPLTNDHDDDYYDDDDDDMDSDNEEHLYNAMMSNFDL